MSILDQTCRKVNPVEYPDVMSPSYHDDCDTGA